MAIFRRDGSTNKIIRVDRQTASIVRVPNSSPRGPQGPQGEKGEKGVQGDPGDEVELQKSATHIQWRYVGDAEWKDLVALADLKGDKGDPGAAGSDGSDGADGNTVLSGAGSPSSGLGVDGDFYIDTTSKNIYGPKTAGAWGSPTSLIGPAGEGSGDMLASVYDPSGIQSDVYNTDFHVDGTNNKVFTAAEKTKLAGVESGATADQTGAEIKAAYEAEDDTNAFTDAEKSKLAGIESGADVTDAANVKAAGALMQSDLLDEDDMASNDATKPASQQSIKSYVDNHFGTVNVVAKEAVTGSVDGSNTTFVTDKPYAGGSLQVYINGLAQGHSHITETNPATGTFDLSTAPQVGDDISVAYRSATSEAGNASLLGGNDSSYHLNRANHTGTQDVSTITGLGDLATQNTVPAGGYDAGSIDVDALALLASCSLRRTTSVSVTNTTDTQIAYDTADVNEGGMWDPSNPSYVTIPVTGFYIFSASVRWDSNANGSRWLLLRAGAGTGKRIQASTIQATTTGSYMQCVGGLYYFQAGAKISVQVWQSSGGTRTLSADGTSEANYFAISLYRKVS